MAFTPQRKRRKPGERFPTGFIKRKIELIISNQFPAGIREPDLRDILREKWKVSEPKGVKIHLDNLKKKKTLIKEEKKGSPNVWKSSQDFEIVKSLAEDFLKSEDKFEFIRSNYAQSMINEKFMDYFAIDWCREFYRLLQKQGSKMYGKDVDEIEDDKLRNGFYAYFGDGWTDAKGFTKEKLLKILRASPSSLFNFLFPNEVLKEGLHLSNITDYFLYPFVFDMMYALPQGKGMEFKLQLSFGNLEEITNFKDLVGLVGKRDLITPTIKVKTESKIYNPLFTALSQKERREKHEKKVKKRR